MAILRIKKLITFKGFLKTFCTYAPTLPFGAGDKAINYAKQTLRKFKVTKHVLIFVAGQRGNFEHSEQISQKNSLTNKCIVALKIFITRYIEERRFIT